LGAVCAIDVAVTKAVSNAMIKTFFIPINNNVISFLEAKINNNRYRAKQKTFSYRLCFEKNREFLCFLGSLAILPEAKYRGLLFNILLTKYFLQKKRKKIFG
jgi:hypothetical protein